MVRRLKVEKVIEGQLTSAGCEMIVYRDAEGKESLVSID